MANNQNPTNCELHRMVVSYFAKAHHEHLAESVKRGLAQAKARKSIIYTRASSEDATRQAASIAYQTEILMNYAKSHNLTVVGAFNEFCSTRASRRPALSNLMQVALKGNIGKVLCVSLDRISRSYPEMNQITEFLKKKGVEIVTP
ncbi:hypothetical protein BH09PAT1_BH09PAT1_3980 [soil metagenome]